MANKFMKKIGFKGYTLESIAGELGISKDELIRKVNKDEDFMYSEICYLIDLLHLNCREINEIFFEDDEPITPEEAQGRIIDWGAVALHPENFMYSAVVDADYKCNQYTVTALSTGKIQIVLICEKWEYLEQIKAIALEALKHDFDKADFEGTFRIPGKVLQHVTGAG